MYGKLILRKVSERLFLTKEASDERHHAVANLKEYERAPLLKETKSDKK